MRSAQVEDDCRADHDSVPAVSRRSGGARPPPGEVMQVTSAPCHERKGSLRLVVVRTAGTVDTKVMAER